MSDYFEWDGFSCVYLEDSFVMKISELDSELIFYVEFVLTEDHPLFQQPKPGEQYCYHKGKLLFSDVSGVNWKRRSTLSFYDANGEEDYGNIDVLRKKDDKKYEISGDWGSLNLTSSQVKIILDK